jgi:pilin
VVSTNQSSALQSSAFRLPTSALLMCVLLLCACSNEEVTRAKVAEAEATGRQAAQGVENYLRKHMRYPAHLEEAYVRPTPLKEIKLMSVDRKTGVIRVTLAFRPVEGKSLLFTPTRKGKSITWRCTSEDIDPKFLPEACRPKQ